MSKVGSSGAVVSILLGALAVGLAQAQAQAPSASMHAACDEAVHLTQEAEKRLGGALYEGPMEGAQSMPEATDSMPGMAGAHEVHTAQKGGVFYMAPNKINHIEARYSDECGIQLLIYNAFTEPIGVERFQAFVKIIPEDDKEWDKEIRFLSPAAGGGVLQTSGDSDIEGPFKIELYVKFPESDDAELFNIPVDTMAH